MNPLPARRRLYIVWLVFVVLLAGIMAHEFTDFFQSAPPPLTGRLPIFAFHESDLSRVDILHQGKITALMRDATGTWFHHGASHDHHHDHGRGDHRHDDTTTLHPDQLVPSSTVIAERISLIAGMLVDRRIKPEQSLDHYGLANPPTLIAFYGRHREAGSQPLAKLYVGDLLPTQYAYYTMQPGDQELSLIPRYYIALLLALAFGEDQAPTPLLVQAEKG